MGPLRPSPRPEANEHSLLGSGFRAPTASRGAGRGGGGISAGSRDPSGVPRRAGQECAKRPGSEAPRGVGPRFQCQKGTKGDPRVFVHLNASRPRAATAVRLTR